MRHGHATMGTNGTFTERELRNSGLPKPGDLGDAKKEAWALTLGLGILLLIAMATAIEMAL